MNKKHLTVFTVIFLGWLLLSPPPAHANMGLVFRGLAKTLTAAFEIPGSMLRDSTRVMFPFGILTGAVTGTLRTVAGTLGGAYDMARGAAPYAKYMIFFI